MWFERLMGFAEESPAQVRASIRCEGEELVSLVNGRRVRCGRLTTPSLGELRAAVGEVRAAAPARAREVVGDVGKLHRDPANAGALFQAASQFNLLEMTGPSVTPERGVGIYEHDHTQGPTCAIACGGGTIYRNYFAPVGGELGQTAARQIDCLAELGVALGGPGLWEMRNGYALASEAGLAQVNARLAAVDDAGRDRLRGLLRVGVQHDVAVLGTDHRVTQVYGSALPVAYGRPPGHLWEPLARLVLEASYEATVLVARQSGIRTLYLTLLGGGVFGNDDAWIGDAVVRALALAGGLDVRLVSYGGPKPIVARILGAHAAGRAALS
ncbi:MAG: hypothetical protein CVU56_12880 [Deltaproteobacteria bacterium HGW-Deltaproteobacteria-14]|jgi:hypothetical protein|nr:MAG: hypothetical protein CVU56_12880 [Deltaproteobacteria bacterium HGW-Deltaproteobacteria-14]